MAIVELRESKHPEIAYVEGVVSEEKKKREQACRDLYNYCKQYFDDKYRGVFFVGDEYKDEIFNETFLTLWEIIIKKKIYVEDGVLKGKGGKSFSGKLTTFFMSIARLKYLEWVRHNIRGPITSNEEKRRREQEMNLFKDILYEEENEIMLEIIAECISHMSERCNQILTMFYYEEKTLDDIMIELPTFESKNALKTAKYKCLETLRKSAKSNYQRYLND